MSASRSPSTARAAWPLLRYDASKPDRTPQKLLDVSRKAALGWRLRIGLPEGIARTYRKLLDACALSA